MPPSTSTVSMTENGTFEGLFHRALRPEGAFTEALRAAGYDPARPQPRYPTTVWHACLEVARRHEYAHLSKEEGERALGHRFIDGWFETIIGKIIAVGLPLLGPDGTLQRAHRNWAASQPDLHITMRKVAERHWEAALQGAGVRADFAAGLLEAAVRRAGATTAAVTVRERGPTTCVLDARW